MAKNKIAKSVRLTPRIEPCLKNQIEDLCRGLGIKPSVFAREALKSHLEKLKALAA
ncbi:hypothetical protein H6F86_02080 [Phormidium sp. FACHB-592]|uniref:Ribbon-helix-helix protein CopG domain-containing protein n=1 Tax=Stenomitos frigidus AS-A4 TaxID=2933935 RepID=A0ABV0KKE0_9CYAN|nr:hypothetical protein [Phormidium sp. FACHB-592]MBD2072695.1 hypothetical protein [Phormidium sp. FACHB-592]